MTPEEERKLEESANREFFLILAAMFFILLLAATALIYSDLYEPSATLKKLSAVMDFLTSDALWVLVGFVVFELIFSKRSAKQTHEKFKGPGIPGGRSSAFRWITATIAASGGCAVVFLTVATVFPWLGRFFQEYVFIVVSLSVAYAQRLSVARQIARSARFWQATSLFGALSMGLLHLNLFLYNEHSQLRYEPGMAEFGAVVSAIVFGSLLGWPQGGQLVAERIKRLKWSLMTGLGAALATYGTTRLFMLADPYLLEQTAKAGSFLSRSEGLLVSTVQDSLIWIGIACTQAVLIYTSPPVREVEDRS